MPFITLVFFFSRESRNLGSSTSFLKLMVGLKKEFFCSMRWLWKERQHRSLSSMISWLAAGLSLTKKLKTSGLSGLMTSDCVSSNCPEWLGEMLMHSLINLSQQTMNYKSSKEIGVKVTANHAFEDEEATNKPHNPSVEHLLNENRMKELALKKATNLIELLNIELEVERNSSQENMRLLEEELRFKYQKQSHHLQARVDLLEREVKRKAITPQEHDKTIRKSVLTRANSTKSVENIKKRSFHKKYTETLSYEELPEAPPPLQVSAEMYRQHAVEFEEWKLGISSALSNLIKEEYDELESVINAIENISEDYEAVVNYRPKKQKDLSEEMTEIIRSQHRLINSLKAYAQELQDLCKSASIRLSSLLSKGQHQEVVSVSFQAATKALIDCISRKKLQWKFQLQTFQTENHELKNILDSMIKLVREQKKSK